jgi:hypothetical protein
MYYLKIYSTSQASVALTFNPGYLGGWDWEDQEVLGQPGQLVWKTPSPK